MTRAQETLLDTGDPFPRIELETTAGERLVLPDHFTGGWGILLVYRGHW